MRDKKNRVLFTDIECLILSHDFKLPDESQVLLRVPRENNTYNVNLKNIIPSEDLTCLFAKTTIDESNLWRRMLCHINSKTINKLDETSLILKTFITGLENQLSLKVKVIKSDNRTEFKNNDLNQFCEIKEIKREFRAEAVNAGCYVQNRVLVTKPHNKSPYELLHGRTPSIGFMRPFGCPMTILNTLDSLGKFDGKIDEGFLVGYFEEGDQQYVLFLMWSFSSKNPQNTDRDAAFDGKEPEFDKKKHESKVNASPSIRFRDLNVEFEECTNNSSNGVNAASSSVSTAGHNFINSTNDSSAAGPSNAAASPTTANSSLQDASTSTHDSDMLNLEYLTHSDDADDVGAEADINNLQSIISVSPILT
nr:hypothetical protein [Tanacetum cinerariifolium]